MIVAQMLRTLLASALLLVACKSSDGGAADMDLDNKGSGSAKGSSSGFSAELSEPIKDAGKPSAKPVDRGSAATPDAGSAAMAPDAGTPDKGSAAAIVVTPPPDKGSAATPDKGSAAAMIVPPPPPPTDKPRVPAKVSPELAAIKLSLDPNWDRDIGEAGTISFVLKKPSGDQAVFTFTYGYDDPKAPADRDAYMKWLGEQKILTVELNRQRGSAWYLQGTDATGAPAFRYLVNYGGKHLVCGGLLYKDPESSRLGDLRDKVIIQAKEICETLAL